MITLGIYRNRNGKAMVTPFFMKRHDTMISVQASPLIKDGDIVRVETNKIEEIHPPQRQHGQSGGKSRRRAQREGGGIQGRILEVLKMNEDELDLESVRVRFGLSSEFGQKARKELGETIAGLKDDLAGIRRKIEGEYIVTIDSETAKDLDDAVSVKKEGENIRLSVYIADVSLFIRKGSALDHEASERANSFYYGKAVTPMLPETLSNGWCSLNPGEEKFVLGVSMLIDPRGNILNKDVFPAKIVINRRLSYDWVNKALKLPSLDECGHNLRIMRRLMDILRQKRMDDGAIDFDLDEIKAIIDEKGRTAELARLRRGDSERMIEEFMLLANQTIAKFLADSKVPLIYRIHESPAEFKVDNFNAVLESLNLGKVPVGRIDPKVFQKVILKSRDKDFEKLITFMVLRTMQQAIYSPDNKGHFGLAFSHYTHFTSPIRRYPDLIIHRLIKFVLLKRRNPDYQYSVGELSKICERSTAQERLATDAERFYMKLKQVRFLKDKVGKVYDAVITGIGMMGVFCELTKYPVEGLILKSYLMDDYYIFDESASTYTGRKTRKVLKLGKPVKVRVVRVDDERMQIDLQSVEL
jgi:ribonuclease R